MAIHILHQRFDKAETLMKEAAKKGKLAEASPYWPLFDPVREETWFKNLFNMPHGTLPHSKTKRRA